MRIDVELAVGSVRLKAQHGPVGAGAYVGGLVGVNAGAVSTSWASGFVADGLSSGGVAGDNASGGAFTNVYWDEGTTGLSNALGAGSLGGSTNVIRIGGSSGLDPHSQGTYAGFDFTTIWTINPGTSRPYLKGISPQTPPQ